MDYLDPRKRRSHNTRLVIGYVLVAIVIGLATYIINAGANGYGFNVKTGQIIQNALLFADSKPGNAEIFLNGEDKNTSTSARLILPTGTYALTLKKDGYRNWSREFVLNEQSVARYVYPFLFPTKPLVSNLKSNYTSLTGLFTESPDRRWLMVEDNAASTQSPVFDMFDTHTLDDQTPSVQQVGIPAGLLTNYGPSSQLKAVEWSTDNNNLLLQHVFSGSSEFIVFNRAHPDQSFNVNKMFNVQPDQVNLFDKKIGQLYIYRQSGGTLQLGNTGSKVLGSVILKNVLAFKPYGKNLITYVTDNNEPAGTVAARIWSSGDTFKLNEFPAGAKYLIDAAQFQGNFYYTAGSDTADRINIYKNPLDQIKNPVYAKALPMAALRISGGQKISFSENTRFVGVENGQRFAVYDFETQDSYQYPITETIADNLSWMDGHRFIGQSDGKVFVMDYDGTNKQLLTATSLPVGGLFDTEYNNLLTITPSSDGSSFLLQDTDMRAGTDLPKNKQPQQQ
jgi:hypothetical protein